MDKSEKLNRKKIRDGSKECGLKNQRRKDNSNESKRGKSAEMKIKFRGYYIKQVEEFVYSRSNINKEGGIQRESSSKIKSITKCYYHLIKSLL